MDFLSGNDEKRITSIATNVEKGIRDWFVTVRSLGMHEEDFQKWQDELQGELEACISECNQIAQEKQHGLIEKIELLLQTSEQLCKTLNIKMPQIASTGKGLYCDEQYLINQIKVWQDEITLRSSEIEVIKSRRDVICAALDRKPFIIKERLPSHEVMAVYKEKIQELEAEQCHRMVTFITLQKECATLAKEIEFVPNLNFEKNIVTGNNLDDIQLNEANIQRTRDLHNDLVIKRENIEEDVFTLRENVIELWRMLEVDEKYCNDFTKDYFRTNMTTLNAFRREVKRCEDLRKANLKKFIIKHRETLVDLWNQAGYSQAKRDKFRHHLEDDCYTEDLLTLHDFEIERVRHQLITNQKLYEALKQRETLYAKLRDLEQRANAPDRYKNRGGQLLKEEKERKVVTKKIPTIEEQLLELAVNYEMTHGEKFQYGNDDIESLIARDREIIEQEKQLHVTARKLKFDGTTPSGTTIKSPIGTHLSTRRNAVTPHNTKTPMRTPKTAPLRKNPPRTFSITKAKLRLSTGRKRRIAANLQKVKQQRMAEKEPDYTEFEKEMRSRNGFRSTISSNSSISGPTIPNIVVETPRTVDRKKLKGPPCNTKLF